MTDMKKESGRDHNYIEDLEEWQENQYNPGYYLGGKIPGNLLYSGRPKLIGALLIGIGIMTLIPFALATIDTFQNDAARLPIEYVLLGVQIFAFGGFSLLLIINGIRKIIGKKK